MDNTAKNKVRPTTLAKILELRGKFQSISDISYTFSKINKNYPLDFISEEQAKDLIAIYEQLLKRFELWKKL